MAQERKLRVAVIGAGASGVMAAIQLDQAGIDDVTIFEKAQDLGGTWRENRYPGVTCDIPSHGYRYSFAPNPDWSQLCAGAEEINDYIRRTAEDFGIARRIRYGAEIVKAEFRGNQWYLESGSGSQGAFDVVITATGVLHHIVYPDIPDLETYNGRAIHSARWDHGFDYRGKRVGVIGTGSTATQIVPAIIDAAGSLTLFQRTAQWILPLPNWPISEEQKEEFRRNPELLQAEYTRLTTKMNSTFSAAIVGENPAFYETLVAECEANLATVRDQDLRRRLTPDYKVGCKRLVMSDKFYEAIQKPNARLVTEPIERFCPEGVRTADGERHGFDLIVLATGFDTHRFFRPMTIIGPGGHALDDVWAERNQGYCTVAVPGFPNWFMIGGPTSPIGNFSWLVTAETQMRYILQLVDRLRSGAVAALAPKQEAADRFNREVRDRLPHTVWATGCSSWYIDKRGNIASWPWTFAKFEKDLEAPMWEDFELVPAEREPAISGAAK